MQYVRLLRSAKDKLAKPVRFGASRSAKMAAMAQSHTSATDSQIRTIPNDYSLYTPLSKDKAEFRIVQLMPGNEDDPIRCFLTTKSLADSDITSYEALSYCWGSLDQTETIELYHFGTTDDHINGLPPNATLKLPSDGKLAPGCEVMEAPCHKQDLAVTTNLIAALRKLRNIAYYRFLWIDAICINQGDLAERVAQVSVMRHIYEGAVQTLIWLGESDPACDLAMDAIFAIAAFVQDRTGVDPLQFSGESGLVFGPRLLDRLLLEFEHSQGWNEVAILKLSTVILGTFFAEPWFRRVWVLQEVGTASRVVLRYGTRTVGWGAVLIAALWQKRWVEKYLVARSDIPDVEKIYRENTLPVAWPTVTDKRSLAETIFLACPFQSTDPRDRLYALMGLASETWNLQDPSVTLQLQYDNSPEEAFAVFTLCLIKATSSLNILSTATKYSPTRERHLFPSGRSWIPDFDPFNTVQCLLTSFASRESKGKPKKYNACNGLTVFPMAHDQNDVLALHGYTIDSVGFHSAAACESRPGANDGYFNIKAHKKAEGLFRSDSKSALSKMIDHICTLPTGYPTGGSRLEALVSTLQVGQAPEAVTFRTLESDLSREKLTTKSLTASDLVLDFLALCRDCELDTTKLADVHSQQAAKTSEQGSGEQFLHVIYTMANGRAFFTTQTGLMGLCPAAAKAGDCIVVLFGSPVLFVVRKMPSSHPRLSGLDRSDCYEFIGECYLHGKMDGSVVRENMSAGRPPELFVLA